MKKYALIFFFGLTSSGLIFAQSGNVNYSFDLNDPSSASKLLILAETGIDGSMGTGMALIDINFGAIARYSLNNQVDFQAKLRKSLASFHFDPAYRKNFEIEGIGTLFQSNKISYKNEYVELSTEESGNRVKIEYFHVDIPQQNSFGFNAGINFKTLGINPQETLDEGTGEGYTGGRTNVNFSTLSLIGGVQLKRVNASVINLENYRSDRLFDNYVVMTLDGIITPVNLFSDAITGGNVGKELKSDGFAKFLPIGGRFTYNVYGSIPTKSYNTKLFKYTISSSIGYRPYLGFHFDFGLGVMLFHKS